MKRHAEFFEIARNQRARPDQGDARAKFEQAENVRARDAAEQDVADDDNVQSGHSSLLSNRVNIEKPWVGCSCAPSPALMTLA